MIPLPNAADDRLLRAIQALFDFSFGTLWWVRESVWKEGYKKLGQPYDSSSTREGHPGVSVRTVPDLDARGEAVPILEGFSEKGPVAVTGLTSRERKRETFFGIIIKPVKIPLDDFLYPDGDIGIHRPAGSPLDLKKVVVNLDKPRLSTEETSRLWKFLEEKGIL